MVMMMVINDDDDGDGDDIYQELAFVDNYFTRECELLP